MSFVYKKKKAVSLKVKYVIFPSLKLKSRHYYGDQNLIIEFPFEQRFHIQFTGCFHNKRKFKIVIQFSFKIILLIFDYVKLCNSYRLPLNSNKAVFFKITTLI